MKDILEEKLRSESNSFQQNEIDWLLVNIGHENPDIRDNLVFSLLSKGIFKEWLTEEQFQYLVHFSMEKDLIFYQLDSDYPAVFTRSFSALLNAYLIKVDGTSDSKYFQLLTEKEHVFTGYSEKCGWVHAFAHGADTLAFSLTHPDFPERLLSQVFHALEQLFLRLPQAFVSGEERRLGRIIEQGILSGKMSQENVAQWLKQIQFPLEKNIDYVRLATFEVFLAYIYFHLLDKIEFEDKLKTELLNILKEI